MLRITDVSYTISDRFSLKELNLQIEEGTHVAIIGESGCGKTTLLKLIYGLYDTDAGTIFWKEQPITGPKENLVPGMPFIKYLSQDFDLMPYIKYIDYKNDTQYANILSLARDHIINYFDQISNNVQFDNIIQQYHDNNDNESKDISKKFLHR